MAKVKLFSNDLYKHIFQNCRNFEIFRQLSAHEYINTLFDCANSLDRSGAINIPLKSHRGLLPLDTNFVIKTFEELCLERANYFLNLNKPIRVYWSGGIDSTGVLVSFMKIDSNWQKNIEIMTTNSAVTKENPFFYNKFLLDCNINTYNICELYEQYMSDPDYINILGIHGSPFPRTNDSYWRSRISAYNLLDSVETDISFDNIKDVIKTKKLISLDNFLDIFLDKNVIIDQIESYKKVCPVEIKTLSDLQWFIWLSRWGKAYNVCVHRSKTAEVMDTIVGFYDTQDFIKYALSNITELKKHTISKYPLKKMIYDYDKNEDYFLNKQPQASTSFAGTEQYPKPFFKLIDTDGNVFTQKDTNIPKNVIDNILND